MEKKNTKKIVRRLFELGNAKDVDAYIDLLHEEFVNHTPPPGVSGNREGYRQVYRMYVNAMPDFHIEVEDMFARGDKCVTRWTATGTQQGELMGIPPTGNEVTITGITINRVEDGKIIEQREFADTMGMMEQLGALSEQGEEAG